MKWTDETERLLTSKQRTAHEPKVTRADTPWVVLVGIGMLLMVAANYLRYI